MAGKEEKIARLSEYRNVLAKYNKSGGQDDRGYLNQNMRAARRDLIELGCFKTYTISPPPAIGGMIIRNADPFDLIFNPPYGGNMVPGLIDMFDQALGVLNDPSYGIETEQKRSATVKADPILKGYVFIAMPMAGEKPEYDDVHDAIKAAAKECGLNAERVDEVQSNERITDRLLESIRLAEYVIADLTDSKPNVFYEAGYAHGVGKIPIYVAKAGTKLEFDLKDYPIIFFSSMRELREGLIKRLRGLAAANT